MNMLAESGLATFAFSASELRDARSEAKRRADAIRLHTEMLDEVRQQGGKENVS